MKKMSFKKFLWNWLPLIWSICLCGLAFYNVVVRNNKLREYIWIGLFLWAFFIWIREARQSKKYLDEALDARMRCCRYSAVLCDIQDMLIEADNLEPKQLIEEFNGILYDHRIIEKPQEEAKNNQEDETE